MSRPVLCLITDSIIILPVCPPVDRRRHSSGAPPPDSRSRAVMVCKSKDSIKDPRH